MIKYFRLICLLIPLLFSSCLVFNKSAYDYNNFSIETTKTTDKILLYIKGNSILIDSTIKNKEIAYSVKNCNFNGLKLPFLDFVLDTRKNHRIKITTVYVEPEKKKMSKKEVKKRLKSTFSTM